MLTLTISIESCTGVSSREIRQAKAAHVIQTQKENVKTISTYILFYLLHRRSPGIILKKKKKLPELLIRNKGIPWWSSR